MRMTALAINREHGENCSDFVQQRRSSQFRVLYREFLFRMVDRELLSGHAQGDVSKLLGQFAAVLILVGMLLSLGALGLGDNHMPRQAVSMFAWSTEHSLIATTMLVVGLFAVLSWDSTFPNRHDVLVLGPLPVRASTIFLAKVASLAAALSLAVVTLNAASGFLLPLVLAPPTSGLLDLILSPGLYRGLAVYWVTVFAAGAFIVCCILGIQGIAAQLPRRLFLRLSALLQMAAFCLFVGTYFLAPSLARAKALAEPENQRLLAWLPSYWFLGLFQELNGSLSGPAYSALATLARRAWIGLALAVTGAGVAFLLSYFRTLRKTVDEPDIVPGSHHLTWLPRFGSSFETAVVQFSIRALFRSRRHRLIFSFYSGIGFAILILFLKTSFAQRLSASANDLWHHVSVPLLVSSFVMMCFWVLGIRVVFAMPLELRANWIFRISPLRGARRSLGASRRTMYVLALAPILAASAAVFLSLWPWRPAAEHLTTLGLLGFTLIELCLYRFQKIPFTCSYLPGKSNVHITFWLCLMLGLNITYRGAEFERRALSDESRYSWLFAILCIAAVCARWRTERASLAQSEIQFEETSSPPIAGLGLHRDGTLPIDHSSRLNG